MVFRRKAWKEALWRSLVLWAVVIAGCTSADRDAQESHPEDGVDVAMGEAAGPAGGGISTPVEGVPPENAPEGLPAEEGSKSIEPPGIPSQPPIMPMSPRRGSSTPRPRTIPQPLVEAREPEYETRPQAAPSPTADAQRDVEHENDPHVVQVFYGTDRQPVFDVSNTDRAMRYLPVFLAGVVTVLLGACASFLSRRVVCSLLALVSLGITAMLWHTAHLESRKATRLTLQEGRIYGSDRSGAGTGSTLEVGVCEVSIPPDHRVGKLEAPSILRLEFREDPQKHVILQRVARLEEDVFFDRLSGCIRESLEQQALVFIHGYNVSFEGAVKRTAQIAYDLRFDGAPICYSWPSHGGLTEYTRDEANVAWTVVHLEDFLTRVVGQTGAKRVHLIAHSMGNRALVQALERMALKQRDRGPLFGQIIMAAPDVDAGEFRDRYAPAVAAMAHHVTLYASSHDQALVASTKVHGYTRAGLSGDHLVAVSGLETVDVSPIDTSLIGHSYYGNNPLMIRDMQALVELGTPASGRQWLRRILRPPSLAYWVFRQDSRDVRRPPHTRNL